MNAMASQEVEGSAGKTLDSQSFDPSVERESGAEMIQLVTFGVGGITLAIDIAEVQEINRQLDVTHVPDAPPMIHGVVNLRGDVVTVLDPHQIFGVSPDGPPARRRNLILNDRGERVGILVDYVSDILPVRRGDLTRKPTNVSSVDRRFISAVYLREDHTVVVLDPNALLDTIGLPAAGQA